MTCPSCHGPVTRKPGAGRPPTYCSDVCRWRHRHARRHPPPHDPTPSLEDLVSAFPTLDDLGLVAAGDLENGD
jgi:hypothetical protein